MNVSLRTMGGSISHFAQALPTFSPLTKKIAAFVGIIFAAMISIYAILKLTEKLGSTFEEKFDDLAPIVKKSMSSSKVDNVIPKKITNETEKNPEIKEDEKTTDSNQPKQETEIIEVLGKKTVNSKLTLQNILDKAEEEFKNDPLKGNVINYIRGEAAGQYNSGQFVSKFQIKTGRETKQFAPSENPEDTFIEKAAGDFLRKLGIEVIEAQLPTESTNPSQKVII